jgi:hypothetical protein
LLPEEETQIRAAIKRSGKTKSDWLREALVAAATAALE